MKISRPTENEYDINSYQHSYIQAVSGENALKTLKENLLIVDNFFKTYLPRSSIFGIPKENGLPSKYLDTSLIQKESFAIGLCQ
jgi:hypothetical protein